MADYTDGIKKEVAEIKFLIHDLRVERFINNLIHFHVTLDTDLEIYGVDQAHQLHADDLKELKSAGRAMRLADQEYANAVQNFSPDKTVIRKGKKYVVAVRDICDLILNPRWGKIDKVLGFLPQDARSVGLRLAYRNSVRWICGVQSRIKHFCREQSQSDMYERFDVAAELQHFTRNVVHGYVVEKSGARVAMQLERLDAAILGGNRYRFRRMFFNLVMNSVDAMQHRRIGELNVGTFLEGDRLLLRVRDNGIGMSAAKIQQLLSDIPTLDGELHSLGFVFVRQTIADFGAELSIESEEGKGTTVTISFPHLVGVEPLELAIWDEDFSMLHEEDQAPPSLADTHPPAHEREEAVLRNGAKPAANAGENPAAHCGALVFADYRASEADFPGSIFAISVTAANEVDFFLHRPYERLFNITHEDLSPMFFEATVRGRIEEDDDKNPLLILKAPQNIAEFFEFKEVPENERSAERFIDDVHDEYIRVARKLIATGLNSSLGVHLSDVARFFPDNPEMHSTEPVGLESLARLPLSSE
ncbi:MAG: ATP-binding protein [Planctomycetota bacterium]